MTMLAAQSPINDTAVGTLKKQFEAQLSAFKRQLVENLVVFSVITDRLNHLKQNL